MRAFLRSCYYFARQGHDTFVGPNLATLNRLERAGRVTIGEHTRAYSLPVIRHYIHDQTRLTVGDYCSLSPEAVVYLGGKHSVTSVTTYPHRILWKMEGAGEDLFPTPTGDTWIGSDVWLCAASQVMSGLRIGHGAIIGAGSIVTRDVPDYAVVGGNPARVIRYRFDERQVKELLDIAWWDWPEDEVREAVPLLAAEDVEEFIGWARARGR